MKKKTLILTVALCLSLSLFACGKESDPLVASSEPEIGTTVEESVPEATEEVPEESEEPEVEHRTGEDIVGISDKDIEKLGPVFSKSVINDKTGNWRLAKIAENVDIENYILSYYNKYFESDSEIHAIVDFTRNITTKVSVSGGTIFVSQYDYVKGEEHDANLLFGGTYLGQYWIYIDNGDIELIE